MSHKPGSYIHSQGDLNMNSCDTWRYRYMTADDVGNPRPETYHDWWWFGGNPSEFAMSWWTARCQIFQRWPRWNIREGESNIWAGWWFGCHFIFSQKYWVANHPNWRTHIFQRGSNHQPVEVVSGWVLCSFFWSLAKWSKKAGIGDEATHSTFWDPTALRSWPTHARNINKNRLKLPWLSSLSGEP